MTPIRILSGVFFFLGFTLAPALSADQESPWHGPADDKIPPGEAGELIRYGRELIASTSHYFGPEGTLQKISNRQNCQNCHLDAGTRPWGNSFFAVDSIYPIFRARSGAVESIEKRITDCFERSMNGRPPEANSREMLAMEAYIKWVGTGVAKGTRPLGTGLKKLPYLSRAADPAKGKEVYTTKCAVCHGPEGKGGPLPGGAVLPGAPAVIPPLWGDQSYNDGAGLYRLSSFAAFARANMPYGVVSDTPALTEEEAWDVAAFVNSQPRPHFESPHDWPDISKKPVDHPYGPYSDSFSQEQHKYGPFQPIAAAHSPAATPQPPATAQPAHKSPNP